MVVVLDYGIKDSQKNAIKAFLSSKGFRVREIIGEEETILGAVGIVSIDIREVELLPGVDRVIPITKPYKLASREFKKEDTIIPIRTIKIGGPRIVVMAGPCAVESRTQILEIAQMVKESGAVILRGGAYKPRTSPYAFQGLAEEGLKYLKDAGEKTGMPVVSEIVSTEHAAMMKEYTDILQIGARNMQNFELLKAVGSLGTPVLLKRGSAATIQELLLSAEYLLAHGCDHVILCERGIKTFETYTRHTLDLSAIPVVKKLSHLPIIVDPSHGTGIREKVPPMALAAVASGAHGIMVEVHTDPDNALSDGPQSLFPEQFEKLMRDIEALSPVLGKEIARLPEDRTDARVASVSLPDTGLYRVAFQGERGAFSEQAIHRYFSEDVILAPQTEFRDVFDSVLEGKAHFGAVPVENSLSGSIHQNYDLLLQYPDLKIVGEKKIRIIHNLIGFPDTKVGEIERVYSHPQGLAQCAKYLESYPHWEQVSFYDTAGSVAFVAREGKKEYVAIASDEAARVYKMHILKESIETNAQNYTRFVIIAHEDVSHIDNPNQASFVFSTYDKPGALFAALKVLADRGLNMKKLESRPIPGQPWEYMFYVDVEVSDDMQFFFEGVEGLKEETDSFRILGLYRV